ncbi:MAG: hypothetical protein R3B45_03235 [Bdellovibrionota bacterium]
MFRIIVTLLISTFMGGCGVFGSKKKNNKHPIDKNSDIILLNKDDQKSLDKWKASLIKSCNIHQIFDGPIVVSPDNQELGVDLETVFAKSGRSILLEADSGGFIVLDDLQRVMFGTTKTAMEISVNASTFEANAIREGSHCKVFINKKLAYETFILPTLPIAAYGNGKLTPAEFSSAYSPEDKITKIYDHNFDRINRVFVENNPLWATIEEIFGTNEEESKAYFELSDNLKTDHTLTIDDLNVSSLNQSNPALLGNKDELNRIFVGDKSIRVNFAISPNQVGEGKNIADNGTGIVNLVYTLDNISNKDGKTTFSVTGVEVGESSSFSAQKAIDCLNDRKSKYQFSQEETRRYYPSYEFVSVPCETFTENMSRALFSTQDGLDILNSFFASTKGDYETFYAGWDQAMIDTTSLIFSEGLSFNDYFRSTEVNSIIYRIEKELGRFSHILEGNAPLSHAKTLLLKQMILQWPFVGEHLSEDEYATILSAIGNTVLDLPASTETLIRSLANRPAEQGPTVQYAANVSDEDKLNFHKIKAGVIELNVPEEVVAERFSDIIQKQVSRETIKMWAQSVYALAEFSIRDRKKLEDSEDPFYQRSLDKFILRGFQENWQAATIKSAESIALLAKFGFACDKTTTVDLAHCVGDNVFSNGDNGILKDYDHQRQAKLATVLTARIDSIDENDRFPLVGNILDTYFNVVWSSCDDAKFKANSDQLDALILKWSVADFGDQYDIKNEIDALLQECR